MRQDAEDELIKQSVTLDYTNKKILATMPMRGKEEDFLKSNRPTAKCILDQQCRKLSKNPEDVKTTLKAFKKLFENGHMVLLKDMPQEIQKKFINKPV